MSEQKVGPPPLWQKETRTKLVEIINQEDEIVYQRDEMAATPQGFYEESDLDLAVDSVNALHAAGLTPEQVEGLAKYDLSRIPQVELHLTMALKMAQERSGSFTTQACINEAIAALRRKHELQTDR